MAIGFFMLALSKLALNLLQKLWFWRTPRGMLDYLTISPIVNFPVRPKFFHVRFVNNFK